MNILMTVHYSGWVHHNAIMPFSDDYTSIKASKKYTSTMVQRAIDALSEAGPILHDAEADNSLRFYDRMYVTWHDMNRF